MDVADLLNSASIASENEKVSLLSSAFELLFFKETHLLADYYRSLIEFAYDRSTIMIKKQIIGFIETTCKKYPQYLNKSKDVILFLLNQETPSVIKRVILCFTNIIRSTLSFILNCQPINEATELFNSFNEVKGVILKPQSLDNEATLVNTLKMIEILVLCFSSPTENGGNNASRKLLKSDEEFSLDRIPDQHPILNKLVLSKECESYYLGLLIDHVSVLNNMTSTNIMTLMTSLSSIVKQRLAFAKIIVPMLSTFPSNLPKLSTVQNESVKHSIKTCLLSIIKLKNQAVAPYIKDLIEAASLVDGKDHAEDAARWYRGEPEKKKRNYEQQSSSNDSNVKKVKMEDQQQQQQNIQNNMMNQQQQQQNIDSNFKQQSPPQLQQQSILLDLNYRQGLQLDSESQSAILSNIASLNPEFVVDLVIENMKISPLFYLLNGIRRNPNTETLFQFVNSYQQPSPQQLSVQQQQQQQPPGFSSPPQPQQQQQNEFMQIQMQKQQQLLYQQQQQQLQQQMRDPRAMLSQPSQPSQQQPPGFSSPPVTSVKEESAYQPDLEDYPIQIEEEKSKGDGNQQERTRVKKEKVVEISNFVPKPNFKIPKLSKEQVQKMMDRALQRIKSSEKGATQGGKVSLWSALFARLLSQRNRQLVDQQQDDQVMKEENGDSGDDDELEYSRVMIDFCLEEFGTRRELALRWLHSELLASMDIGASDAAKTRYSNLLLMMVEKVQASHTGDGQEKTITDFILEVPLVTDGLLQLIVDYCKNIQLVGLGLNSFCDLILWRPNLRQQCLNSLLEFSVDRHQDIRSKTIRVLTNQLFCKPSLEHTIQKFAIDQLISVIHIKEEEEEDEEVKEEAEQKEEKEQKEEEENGKDKTIDVKLEKLEKNTSSDSLEKETSTNLIERKLLLFFSLCAKKPLIATELLQVYSRCSDTTKEVIHKHIGTVMKTIGQANEDILQVLTVCPKGAENLVSEMLGSLVNGERPVPKLVDTVKNLLDITGETKFLLPVVHGLPHDEVIASLPTFLSLSEADLRNFVTMLAIPGSPLTPSELLVQLHLIADTNVNKRQIVNAIDQCTVQMQSVFKPETLAVAIQQLVTQPTLSPFLLRTMLQSLNTYPNLRNFIVEMMRELVSKQVWNDKGLWNGFIICALKAKPESLPVIFDLPSSQFQLAIENDELRRTLQEFIQSKDPQSRNAFSRNNLKLLDQFNK
ncbi:symplekin [Cavenderia fasciculata]|uniref:Symplekin n=1 Tax=Cavenderia fasciculata TaxID=261658 RepID=F4Q935_CACFS|nr:symplekin [Cavenderia fasciculata]EGG15204.1 symplekin [Cavenderia fasciculata]|eukprot:XP_004351924.1 symplekin [Cavenderia fasciculata]